MPPCSDQIRRAIRQNAWPISRLYKAVEWHTFLLFGRLVSYDITIKPKNYILYPQGLLNNLVYSRFADYIRETPCDV